MLRCVGPCREALIKMRLALIARPSTLFLSPSGWGGVSHTGSPSPFSTIPCVLHREPQVLHVVLDDVNPSLSLSSSTSLSLNICLQDSLDTIILFSPLYMPIPCQSGLAYFVRDAGYSSDVTDVVIPFLSFGVRRRIQRLTFARPSTGPQ